MKLFSTALRVIPLLAIAAFLLTGCLTPEKKEYTFRVNEDGSGSGTIRYINIVSQDDEEKDVSFKDFAELVTDYMEGDKFTDENPQYTVTDKKLYEEDGVLVGEFSFTFTAWDSAGFFRAENCDCCPTLYFVEGMNNETYESSNGEYLGETGKLPLIRYPAGAKEFSITTSLLSDLTGTHPLIEHYRNWKK